jgi:hypothetical protein
MRHKQVPAPAECHCATVDQVTFNRDGVIRRFPTMDVARAARACYHGYQQLYIWKETGCGTLARAENNIP